MTRQEARKLAEAAWDVFHWCWRNRVKKEETINQIADTLLLTANEADIDKKALEG